MNLFQKALCVSALMSSVSTANLDKLPKYNSPVSQPASVEYVASPSGKTEIAKNYSNSLIDKQTPQSILEADFSNANKKLFNPQISKISPFEITSNCNFELYSDKIDDPVIMPYINYFEVIQLDQLWRNFLEPNLESCKNFIQEAKTFSENQKIILLSDISNFLYFSYVPGEYVCRHIASDIEQSAKELGLECAVVTGRITEGHTYDILKLKDRTAIVDGRHMFITNTKNIEKTLCAYQKEKNSLTIHHLFFEDDDFKYRLITKDGKRFLDFIDYDVFSKKSLGFLTNSNNKDSNSSIIVDSGNYTNSITLNYSGLFAKLGEIRGDSLSSLDKMLLFQVGYKNDFSTPGVFHITPNVSIVYGNAFNNPQMLIGGSGDINISSDNQTGLNGNLRVAGHISSQVPIIGESSLFHDFFIENGASFNKTLTENFGITPYFSIKSNLSFKTLKKVEYELIPSELKTGIISDFNLSGGETLSINPSYSLKMEEQEFGLNAKLKTTNLELGVGGYATDSNYKFCPDRYGFNADLSISDEHFNLEAGCKDEITNYDGEIDHNLSFSVNGSIKF